MKRGKIKQQQVLLTHRSLHKVVCISSNRLRVYCNKLRRTPLTGILDEGEQLKAAGTSGDEPTGCTLLLLY